VQSKNQDDKRHPNACKQDLERLEHAAQRGEARASRNKGIVGFAIEARAPTSTTMLAMSTAATNDAAPIIAAAEPAAGLARCLFGLPALTDK
jgi:hypothetical protein